MKKKTVINKQVETNNDDMKPEYDFTGGVRGKHHKAYQKGHAVQIHKADGTTSTQYFTLKEGAVMLAPDVRMHFRDSDAVNEALRSLIAKKRQTRRKVIIKVENS